MGIFVVSDLHGAADALKKAVPEGSTLLLLGDLLNLLDYTDMTGMLAEIFGREAVEHVARLRAEGDIHEARRVMQERAAGRENEVREELGRRAREQYEGIFAALPDPTYLILGNVDNPGLARGFVDGTPAVRDADGSSFVLGGERFGFVGGALPSPLRVAGEISEEEFERKVEAIGEVDVLCSHIPPAVPDLCYDTLARHGERGSTALLRYIEDVQPRRAYFGHVHQPLISAMHIGRTLCINVGYFRGTRRAFPHGV